MIARAPVLITLIALIGLGASDATAGAQALPPITDRAWTLDLYDGAAIGSARIVGMGGVQLAIAEGSAGTLANPAAPAVRPATSTDRWDWDFHLDALSAVVASDFSVGKLAVGYAPGDETWSVGAAVRVGRLDVEGAQPMFALVGSGLEVGGLYRPFGRALRVGAVASLAVPGKDVETAACDPADCAGYILPRRVEVPWQVGVGVAWRFAPTAWNQWVGGRFRDERQVIVAADLVVAGPVAGGMGLEAFARKQWQPSGRAASWWLRGGVEWEALPGRVRLRGGSYWEPGRFAGVGGRLHATGGLEIAVVSVRAWSRRYRVRAGVTGDFARAFGNAGLAVGFWH